MNTIRALLDSAIRVGREEGEELQLERWFRSVALSVSAAAYVGLRSASTQVTP